MQSLRIIGVEDCSQRSCGLPFTEMTSQNWYPVYTARFAISSTLPTTFSVRHCIFDFLQLGLMNIGQPYSSIAPRVARYCSGRPRCSHRRIRWTGGTSWIDITSASLLFSAALPAAYCATAARATLSPSPVSQPLSGVAVFSLDPRPRSSLASWLTLPPSLSSLPLPPLSWPQPPDVVLEYGIA